MSLKKTVKNYSDMAESRNHKLISVSNTETPSQGKLTILCGICGETFTTSAHSYCNARASGCPSCKAIKARNQSVKAKNQSVSVTAIEQSKIEQKRKEKLSKKLAKRKNFEHIRNSEGLFNYLKKENNKYTLFIMDKIKTNASISQKITNKNFNFDSKQFEKHHIIPKHIGGPNASWNLVYLSKEDHVEAHLLRYEVYGEFGDYNFLSTKNVLGSNNRVKRNPEFDKQLTKNRQIGTKTQIANQVGIFNHDAARRAGLISKKVIESLTEEEKRTLDKRHQTQMSDAVWSTLYKGATFIHSRTGTKVILKPEEALTLTQLKNILVAALPKDDVDRAILEKAEKPVNVTSSLAKIIKGERPSAYGWKLIKD